MVERRKKEKEMMAMTMMSDKEESDPCPSYFLLPSYILLQPTGGVRYSPCSRFALIGKVASRLEAFESI